jgi:addiction module HigA family antidote
MGYINDMSKPLIHPGQHLSDELKDIGVTPTELARQIEVPANRISEIIRARRSITGDTALRLSHWFGTTPQFWMNLQSAYDLRLAAQRAGEAISRLPRRGDKAVVTGMVTPADR